MSDKTRGKASYNTKPSGAFTLAFTTTWLSFLLYLWFYLLAPGRANMRIIVAFGVLAGAMALYRVVNTFTLFALVRLVQQERKPASSPQGKRSASSDRGKVTAVIPRHPSLN